VPSTLLARSCHPFETEGLPLPEAEARRDDATNSVPLALGRFNQLLNPEHRALAGGLSRIWHDHSRQEASKGTPRTAADEWMIPLFWSAPIHLRYTLDHCMRCIEQRDQLT
jgi:hypothetical protein